MSYVANAFDAIPSGFDRFQETHFWLHEMERNYHFADSFRWSLSAFLKALKEAPNVIQMELQHKECFTEWFRPICQNLQNEPLMRSLAKHRDVIVHRTMLAPESKASIGTTELRGMKLGMSFKVDPFEDSSAAMERYLAYARTHGDFIGILVPDEDSLPCVERTWRLPGIGGEVTDVCAKALLLLAGSVRQVVEWLGAEDMPELTLHCRHADQELRFMTFDRAKLIARFEGTKNF